MGRSDSRDGGRRGRSASRDDRGDRGERRGDRGRDDRGDRGRDRRRDDSRDDRGRGRRDEGKKRRRNSSSESRGRGKKAKKDDNPQLAEAMRIHAKQEEEQREAFRAKIAQGNADQAASQAAFASGKVPDLPTSGQPEPAGHRMAVDAFFNMNKVERHVEDRLRQLPWEYQANCIGHGPLAGPSPTADLVARIKSAIDGVQQAAAQAAAAAGGRPAAVPAAAAAAAGGQAPGQSLEEMQYALAVQMQLQAQNSTELYGHHATWHQPEPTAAPSGPSWSMLKALSSRMG